MELYSRILSLQVRMKKDVHQVDWWLYYYPNCNLIIFHHPCHLFEFLLITWRHSSVITIKDYHGKQLQVKTVIVVMAIRVIAVGYRLQSSIVKDILYWSHKNVRYNWGLSHKLVHWVHPFLWCCVTDGKISCFNVLLQNVAFHETFSQKLSIKRPFTFELFCVE